MTAKPTAAEIEAAKSERGGWNKETLAKWGIAWPPQRGWRKRLLAGLPPVSSESESETKSRLELRVEALELKVAELAERLQPIDIGGPYPGRIENGILMPR